MNKPLKQHLIDPEICIRCYSCEAACPIGAISHDDNNVVVDATSCEFCMSCIPVCPTGSIDEWRVVEKAFSLEEQFAFEELPTQDEIALNDGVSDTALDALDENMAALLEQANSGAGGKAKAPASASKPTINMYNLSNSAEAVVQGNYRLTAEDSDSDVRHIILNMGQLPFPVLEGQSVGVIPPGLDDEGNPQLPRLYSVSSPRDGERPNFNNLSLTIKREEKGLCSNYMCDLQSGDKVQLTGPFGATFLLPSDPQAHLLMICTGTGSAPFRGFTMRRMRSQPNLEGSMTLIFGARKPNDLPYFGPLKKMPEKMLSKYFAFSRDEGQPKEYVQDKLRQKNEDLVKLLNNPNCYIYVCGLKAMEQGVNEAMADVARGAGLDWETIRSEMRESGRYHVETY